MKKSIVKNWLILVIVLLAVFLRLYRLPQVTTFLGEQGRDLIIANTILQGKLTLLGPPTSMSNVHFGPFYHYFNAFFLLLFNRNPIGPAIGFSLLSITSVYFVYSIAALLGHKRAGYFSALLWAVSPWMVEYGRNIFNSYFITGFSVFAFWCLVKFLKTKELKSALLLLLLAGVFSGLAVQANFLAAGLPLGLFLILILKKVAWKKHLLFCFGLFLAILPYLVFELRHQFFNTRAFLDLSRVGKAITFSGQTFLQKLVLNLWQVFYYLFGFGYINILSTFLLVLILLGVALVVIKDRKSEALPLTFIMLFTGLIIPTIYPGQMLVHYLGVVYPYAFLLVGLLFESLSFRVKYVSYFLIAGLVILNLNKVSFVQQSMPKGWDLAGVRLAARIIEQDAEGNFNIANLLDGDTRAYSYRYFVQLAKKQPLGVEDYPKADTLYVIARDTENVLDYPVWEISSFTPAKITKTWPIKNSISVFKLEKI